MSDELFKFAKRAARLEWPQIGKATYIRPVSAIPAWWDVGDVKTFHTPGGTYFKACYHEGTNTLLLEA